MKPKKPASPGPQQAAAAAPTGEKLVQMLQKQAGGRLRINRNDNKTAQALRKVAGPLIRKSKKPQQLEQGLRTAMVAWNLASVPEGQRQQMMEEAVAQVWWPFRWFVRRMMRTMVQRKKEMYPHDRSMIADLKVSGTAPDFNVQVTTVQPPR